ncbi:MAG TPA: PGPGW domain-containing protein [Polyangiaceae bacterium]|nr:PGPGW domain-containing protein [Polyangiaceae bacterium]
MLSTLSRWFENPVVDGGLLVFSLLAVLASVLLVPRFLARLPRDYLRQPVQHQASVFWRVLRNVAGALLVLLGVAMLVLPGQGLLTLLVGLMLVDFPGKHQLIVKLLSRPKVLNVVNKLRARHHADPLLA